jgi:hypothetical protein
MTSASGFVRSRARNRLPTFSDGVLKLVVSSTPGKRVAIATTSCQVASAGR